MTDAEKYALLINIIVPIVSAAGAAWVSFKVANNQIEGDRAIFQTQIQLNNAAEVAKERSNNTNKLTNFSWLLNNIIKFSTEQNKDYLLVANNIEQNKLGQHPLVSRVSTDIVRILQINQEEVFFALIAKAIDTKENRIRVGRIYSKLDFINAIIIDVKFKFEGYHVTMHSLITEYREHLESVRESVSNTLYAIRKSSPSEFKDDTLFIFLNNTLADYSKNMPQDAGVEWHHPNFLRPLQEHLAKNFLYDDRVQNILTQGRRASIISGRMLHEAGGNVQMLKTYNTSLTKVIEELKTECDFIEELLATA